MATTVSAVVVVQAVSATEAFGDESMLIDSAAADYPLAGIAPATDGNPSVVYAGQVWSVGEVRVNEAEGLLERASLEVDATVTNSLAATTVRVPDSVVSLVHADGHVVGDARFVGAGTRLSLAPGETTSVTIAFTIGFTQTPDVADLTLQIGEANRIPAMVALDGTEADHEFPIYAAVETAAKALTDPDAADRQIVVAPTAAAVDINAGPYRAAEGERLAIIEVDVQRGEASDTAGYLDPSFWSLMTESGSYDAILVANADSSSNSDSITLLFAFAESDELTLVAGAGMADSVTFSVVLPN